MSIVVINALSVPEGQGSELEARFAARKHAVDQAPGFEGFKLLRPTGQNTQYFVYTQWASQEDYDTWRDSRENMAAHAGADNEPRKPVASGSELLEFDVVEL